jgi:hypothetical protein
MTAGRSERYATAGILLVIFVGWYALAAFLGRTNVYWAGYNPVVPTILFGILIPIVVGFYGVTRNRRFARLAEGVPLSALVGVQVFRVLGAIFLVLWADGQLPWQFALPAGIGDVATGVLAVVVAGMLAAGAAGANRAAFAWCIFGIADLVVAVTMGALTSPGITNLLSRDAPNLLVTAYPLVMIPTFAVPLSIILHSVCLWKLQRARGGVSALDAVSLYDLRSL